MHRLSAVGRVWIVYLLTIPWLLTPSNWRGLIRELRTRGRGRAAPLANHALPEQAEHYEPVVKVVAARRT